MTDSNSATTAQDEPQASEEYVTLTVNLALDVAEGLRELAKRRGVSLTEELRSLISLGLIVDGHLVEHAEDRPTLELRHWEGGTQFVETLTRD